MDGWKSAALLLALAVPAFALDIRVLDSAGNPLPEALVWSESGQTNRTDKDGLVRFPQGITKVTAWKPGLVPFSMSWPSTEVTTSFDFKLPEAEGIGGRIVDDKNQPVAGAQITLAIPARLIGAKPALDEFPIRSDTNGDWRCEVVPKNAAYIELELSHPDYEPSGGSATVEDLRAGKAIHKMSRIVTLAGRVLDVADSPVAGAEIVMGNEYSVSVGSSVRVTETDSQGRFEFPRTRPGKRFLGLKHANYAPTTAMIGVSNNAVELGLKPGKLLRVRVTDQDGKSISGAEVQLTECCSQTHAGVRTGGGSWSYPGLEWTTDGEGRFVWSNAPPDTAYWSFSKGGYMTRSHHALNPSENEQVIKLGLPFHISGTVMDADTGRPVREFVISAAYVLSNPQPHWNEYNRQQFKDGKFQVSYTYPLFSGGADMHDWQFRVEADGYETQVSRVVRDAERGAELKFPLARRPLPELNPAAPSGKTRVTAAAAFQPAKAKPNEMVTLYIKARVAEGHWIYALEDSGTSNLPTSIDASVQRALKKESDWQSPPPKTKDDGSRTLSGDIIFRRRFLVERNARPGTQSIPIELEFQVCNDALCWPPDKIRLQTTLEVLPVTQ
jgi:hypothetical protein